MSGINWVIDTNVIIGLLKGDEPAAKVAEAAQLDLQCAAVSQITRMELLSYPQLTEEEESQIKRFLDCVEVCLIDEPIENEAIRLRRALGLKLPDAIIAATAVINNARLLTLDLALTDKLKK